MGRADDRCHVRILMATRDGAVHLHAQLDSFLQQDHGDWSLAVSDDGSTDETPEILSRFARAHPQRIVSAGVGPCRGAAANFLSLIADHAGSAPFVALSDQDDVWLPHRLSRGVAALAGAPAGQPALYGARTVLTGPALAPVARGARPRPRPSFGNALVQNVVAGNTMMLNHSAAELIRRHMPAAPVPFHDWWIYLLVTGAGGLVYMDDEPVLLYRQHDGNALGAHHGWRARRRRAALVLRGDLRRWIAANHRALATAAGALTPENRSRFGPLLDSVGAWGPARLRALRAAGAHRQGRHGTAALKTAAFLGLA